LRGYDRPQSTMLTLVNPEQRVPATHPIRLIKELAEVALKELSPLFEQMYSELGRPSIPPERLLKASLLMALYTVRSERMLCEQLDYNLLFRWFLDLNWDEPSFDHSTFSRNRGRLLEHDVAGEFFRTVVAEARELRLTSDEHFTVDGTLIEAWASLKSLRPKGEKPTDRTPPDDPGNPSVDFHGERQTVAKFHFHTKLCPLQHRLGVPSKCGFDFDHFLEADFCKKAHHHTHDGKLCTCSFGHYHEVPCDKDHGVAASRNAARVYLGARSWSLANSSLDPADKNFLIKFVSHAPGLLRDLYDLRIDPAEAYSLCLKTAPVQDEWGALRNKDFEVGRELLLKAITWLRTTATAIPPHAISVLMPGPGERVVTKPGVPLNPALFREMLAAIRETRTDKDATTINERLPLPPEEQIRSINLAAFRVDRSLILHLEALTQQLEVISEVRRRSRGAPREQFETSFIRGFTRLARQKEGRPLDGLGAELFEFVFSRRIDVESYTKRRSEIEAPSKRRGALGRAMDFLKRELAAGRQPVSKLVSRAHVPDVSRSTLFRAARELGLETAWCEGAACWSLREDPIASGASTKRK
jgi:transposase